MTPKEFEFWFSLLQVAAEESYKLGYNDARDGKPERKDGFVPNRATRLTVKTNLKKMTERR